MDSGLERRRLLAPPCPSPTPALFLDRDGVVIEDRHHLCDPKAVVLCSGAQALLQEAKQAGLPVVLITNQSGIARGYFDWEAYEQVTDKLLELLGVDASVAAIYANGHGPGASPQSWRKPSPAMLLAAAADLQLDLSRSMLVGDRLSDLQAGARAGLPWLAHVLSGHGQQERAGVQQWWKQNQEPTSENGTRELLLLQSLLDFPVDRFTCA
jgi:D-glycero-D-manno-heptose 1,7-bisphosphate phosphatase